VILVALVVLNLPGRASSRLKLAIGSLFLPLFGLASGVQQTASKSGDVLLPKSELVRQLELLRMENQQLRLQTNQAAQIWAENNRLRQLYGWQQQKPWKLKLAHVVYRDPANWWRTVGIDLGSRDGLKENQPVLTSEGLVGRVLSVSYTRSQVVLLGDPNCKVSAIVENDAHDQGVIGASGLFDGSLVEMNFLPHNSILKPGQNVVTSDLGGLFPRGIPIGKIVDAQQVEFGLSAEADVKLLADLSSLEEVWVLFQ
jgi:rod shape-determining protein MreC